MLEKETLHSVAEPFTMHHEPTSKHSPSLLLEDVESLKMQSQGCWLPPFWAVIETPSLVSEAVREGRYPAACE